MNMKFEDKYGYYTRMPNSVVEMLAKIKLKVYEYKILFFIARKTYGYDGKEWDRISYTQFEKSTGIKRRHVGRTLKELEEKNIIKIRKKGSINEYKINHTIGTWIIDGVTLMGNITFRGNRVVPDTVTKLLPRQVNTKERNKLLKKEDYLKSLEDF